MFTRKTDTGGLTWALMGVGVSLALPALAGPARADWVQQQKLTASDAAAGDWYGLYVAVDGDTAVVTGYLNDGGAVESGAAYVYERTDPAWSQVAKLTSSAPEAQHGFGREVGIQGDTIVLGAPGDGGGAGAAFVFARPAGGWADMTETARLTASDGGGSDLFGSSAVLDGDTIAIGARANNGDRGAVYVYDRPAGGWASMTQTAKLTAGDLVPGDRLGQSLDLSGGTLVAGLENRPCCGGNDSHAAYVFTRPAGGWADATETAKLTPSDPASRDLYSSVATNGETIMVGAPRHSDLGSWSGSVYIYDRPAGGWTSATQTTKLHAPAGQSWEEFGHIVVLDGERALIASTWGVFGGEYLGAVHIFERAGGVWTETDRFTGSDSVYGDVFSYGADLSGDTAIVGAYLDDHAAGVDAGSAYVFTPEPATLALLGLGVLVMARRRRRGRAAHGRVLSAWRQ